MIAGFGRCPTPMGQLLLENFHGAVSRVKPCDTAFPHREKGYNLIVLSEWMEPADTNQCSLGARQLCGHEPVYGIWPLCKLSGR